MRIEIRYFASIREALGPSEAFDIAPGADVAALRNALIARGGRHEETLNRRRLLRSARNRVLCAESAVLDDGDEVGFFPPVTGG